jgi:hypothetical protein
LEGFELVEVLEKDAVQVGLVTLDFRHVISGEAVIRKGIGVIPEAVATSLDHLIELFKVQIGGCESMALESDEAVEAPQGEGDAVGEGQFEVALGI